MPIYEYICNDCGNQFEELTSASTRDKTVNCPSCGSTVVKKILSAGNVRSSSGPSIPLAGGAASGCPGGGGFT